MEIKDGKKYVSTFSVYTSYEQNNTAYQCYIYIPWSKFSLREYIIRFQEFILSRVRYIERFCKGLSSQGEQNLLVVRIIERLL